MPLWSLVVIGGINWGYPTDVKPGGRRSRHQWLPSAASELALVEVMVISLVVFSQGLALTLGADQAFHSYLGSSPQFLPGYVVIRDVSCRVSVALSSVGLS